MKERQLFKGVKLLKRAKTQGVIHRRGQVKQDRLVTQGGSTSSVIHKPSLSLGSHSALIASCLTWALDDLTFPKVGSLGRYHTLKHLILFYRCKALFYLISLCCLPASLGLRWSYQGQACFSLAEDGRSSSG